ncbi:hypothetical protein JTE90_014482 [Oedothorax gibbosus]|uniref:F-box domain-containing protein n=1 Tax=Oedothorax gibbosus TaxID=931172 RepID=A0AAV6VLF6_9ARAC|nr:hypothetical protein JTE90_014482 [Oedothorax gibbosus]
MADDCFGLHCLPVEIIEKIFYSEELSFIDLCRLSTVCKAFDYVLRSNKIWGNKFKLMWPDLAQLYDFNTTDWKTEIRFKNECTRKVTNDLSKMSEVFYHQDKVSDESFSGFRTRLNDHPLTDQFLIHELENVIYDSECHLNLTQKYYAKRALRYMRHRVLEKVWEHLLENNSDNVTLLQGACLVSWWCQPTKRDFTNKIILSLNGIIKKVFEFLVTHRPSHPALKTGLPILKAVDNVPHLDDSLWDPRDCKRILNAINDVMFEEFKFCGNVVAYFSSENSFIDKVLEKRQGIPITMSVIYKTVAALFGVALLPVNFPGHFLLKWKEYPHLAGIDAYTFVDVFDEGRPKTPQQLQDLAPGYERFAEEWVEEVSPLKAFIRMCWNLVEVGRQHDGEGEGVLCLCDALELLSILSPDDNEHKLLLARVYMHLSINMPQVINLLQEIAHRDPVSTGIIGFMYRSAITTVETQKLRQQQVKLKLCPREPGCEVKFAVGMIMKHKKYFYRCVISGWDAKCTASADWIKQMGVHNLAYKDEQPFYHVLVEDGTNRYAAQENLEIDQEKTIIRHIEVGRFFESFHGDYYLPNTEKLQEYPDDILAREKALRGHC